MSDYIIEKMAAVVEERCTNYKSDFYWWDMKNIMSQLEKSEYGVQFVWLVRETGTTLIFEPELDGKSYEEFLSKRDALLSFYETAKSSNKWKFCIYIDKYGHGSIAESEWYCDNFIEKCLTIPVEYQVNKAVRDMLFTLMDNLDRDGFVETNPMAYGEEAEATEEKAKELAAIVRKMVADLGVKED